MRRFDGSAGEVLTDAAPKDSPQRSYFLRFFEITTGGAGFGRFFDSGTQILRTNGTGAFVFSAGFSPAGVWGSTISIGQLKFRNVVVTYDGSSTANDPLVYLDGVPHAMARSTAPVGTLGAMNVQYRIGNNSVGNRCYNGFIGDFAFWDTILTPTHALELGRLGVAPDQLNGLAPVRYYRLSDMHERDFCNNGLGVVTTAPLVGHDLRRLAPPVWYRRLRVARYYPQLERHTRGVSRGVRST